MRSRSPLAAVSFLSCALVLAASGCSSSGRSRDEGRRTVLISSSDDARVGREASRQVAAQMGLLGDPELDAYVSRIGHKLLRGVEPRTFNYSFQVTDQVEPNAFALPGGYIYVSRGLLVLANDEDELACVIGHEIIHSSRRHTAQQQALERHGNPISLPWTRAARAASYSRDMEREADARGQRLCAAAGYDPMGMSTFLRSLSQAERLRFGFTREPTFMDTHPGSQERAAVNAARAGELRWKRDPELGDTRRSLLGETNGMPVGQRPEGGVFVGDRFLHPVLDFQLLFPPGWEQSSTNQVVGAAAPRGEAIVFLTADMPAGDPKLTAESWLVRMQGQGVKLEESRPIKIGSLNGWRLQLKAGGLGRSLIGQVTFISYGDTTYRITGVSPSSAASQYLGRVLATARSFRPLGPEERAAIVEQKLHVVTADAGESIGELGDRNENAWSVDRTALENALFTSHVLQAGELVKLARTQPYVEP